MLRWLHFGGSFAGGGKERHMGCWFVCGLLGILGVLLLAVGIVFWMSEKRLQKSVGSMGSVWFLTLGGLLCLPLVLLLVPAAVQRLSR
jgi:hypothetical protein